MAVVYEDTALTYAGLDARANQLAHVLIGLGVQPDDRVAICVERGFEMVVGLLGILKAGGAYLPLDLAYVPLIESATSAQVQRSRSTTAVRGRLVATRCFQSVIHRFPLGIPGTVASATRRRMRPGRRFRRST